MDIDSGHYVLWVKREDSPDLDDSALRWRAGVEEGVEVRVVELGRFGRYSLPAGTRTETGDLLEAVLNVDDSVLSPEGKVYIVPSDA